MTGRTLARIALLGAVFWPVADAAATEFPFTISGSGISGSFSLTYETNPNTGILPGTAPNPVDPVGSYIITGFSGTFSDSNIGISNAVVTGVQPLNRVDPEATNFLAPNSFSLLLVANGVNGGVPSPGLHYDNLFYPGGSPQTASDYPASGGVFDIYGVIFTLNDGNLVNLWSNGAFAPGDPFSYGVAVTDQVDALDYVGNVALTPSVPEPATWAMMIAGFSLAGVAMRRQRRISTTAAFA